MSTRWNEQPHREQLSAPGRAVLNPGAVTATHRWLEVDIADTWPYGIEPSQLRERLHTETPGLPRPGERAAIGSAPPAPPGLATRNRSLTPIPCRQHHPPTVTPGGPPTGVQSYASNLRAYACAVTSESAAPRTPCGNRLRALRNHRLIRDQSREPATGQRSCLRSSTGLRVRGVERRVLVQRRAANFPALCGSSARIADSRLVTISCHARLPLRALARVAFHSVPEAGTKSSGVGTTS